MTSVKNHIFALLSVLLLLLLIFSLVKLKSYKDRYLYNQNNFDKLNQESERLEEEVQLLLKDQGKITSYGGIVNYDPKKLGITSDFLKKKQFEKTNYLYRRNKYTSYILKANPGTDNGLYYAVWHFDFRENKDSQSFLNDYVVFDGYENNSISPRHVPSEVKNDLGKYKTENNLSMTWTRNYNFLDIGLCLETLTTNLIESKPLYVKICQGSGELAVVANAQISSSREKEMREKLIKLSDEISLTR